MKNIIDYLEECNINYRNQNIIALENNKITYKMFTRKAKHIGSKLIDNDNNLIVIYMDKDIDLYITMIGVLYSNNYYVVITPNHDINTILVSLKPSYIICKRNDCFETEIDVLIYEDLFDSRINNKALSLKHEKANDNDLAFLFYDEDNFLFTSITHKALISYLNWFSGCFNTHEMVIACEKDIYDSRDVTSFYGSIISGGTLVLVSQMNIVFLLNKYKVNILYVTMDTLKQLCSSLTSKVEISTLRKIFIFNPDMTIVNTLKKQVRKVEYINVLRLKENIDIASYYVISHKYADNDSLPIGYLSNRALMVLDYHNNRGLLYLKDSYLSNGYYNNMNITREYFIQNPLNHLYTDIIYKTNLNVFYNDIGELYLDK